MVKNYFPFDWYWIKKDGSIFSSQRVVFVEPTDEAFVFWSADGTKPFPYPLDADGNESVAELQFSLATYDLSASLEYYAGKVRYGVETSGVKVMVGGEEVTMSTRREDRDGARDTLLAISSGMRTDGAIFKFADNRARPATNDEMKAAIAAAFAHVQASYNKEAAVVADIVAGKLTTKEAVEAAFR